MPNLTVPTITLTKEMEANLERLTRYSYKEDPSVSWPECDLCLERCTSHPYHITVGEIRHVHVCSKCWAQIAN